MHLRDSNIPHLGNYQNSSDLATSSLQLDIVGKSREVLNSLINKNHLLGLLIVLKGLEHTINDLLTYSLDEFIKLKEYN